MLSHCQANNVGRVITTAKTSRQDVVFFTIAINHLISQAVNKLVVAVKLKAAHFLPLARLVAMADSLRSTTSNTLGSKYWRDRRV